MNRKFLSPIIVGIVGLLALALVGKVLKRPAAEEAPRENTKVRVEVMKVSLQDVRFTVTSHGAVQAGSATVLSTRVSGRIEALGKNFAEGGFFERGELLVRLEDQDYRLALSQAQAEAARARNPPRSRRGRCNTGPPRLGRNW